MLGVEVSHSSEKALVQVSAAPGRADAILNAPEGPSGRAFTATGRVQLDLTPRATLVASGLVRASSEIDPRTGAAGVALGFAPLPRLSIWTEGDTRMQQGVGGRTLILVNETSVEAVRGMWLKFSPQLRTAPAGGGVVRLVFEADLLPRTHWNVDLSHYRDRDCQSGLVAHTTLLQLHLYL